MRRVKIYADFPKGITPSYIPKGIARSYISNLISVKDINGRYSLRSSNSILLKAPTWKSLATLGNRSFYVAAPKLWNYLSLFIRNISTVYSFKVCKKEARDLPEPGSFSFPLAWGNERIWERGWATSIDTSIKCIVIILKCVTGFDVSKIVLVRFLIQNLARKFCAKHFPWGIVFIIYILRL